MSRITIKDIAKIANVSSATVSRALNNSNKISPKTRNKILEICENEGYMINAVARNLSRQKSNLIGLVVPDVSNPFFSELVLHIDMLAQKNGYNLILCNSLNNQKNMKEMLDFLISQQVDGIILASIRSSSISIIKKYRQYLPIVLLGGSYDLSSTEDFNLVCINNKKGGELAAKYLLSLNHKKIAYIGMREDSFTHIMRYKGFQNVLKNNNIDCKVFINEENHSSINAGYILAKKLFSSKDLPTAIFATTDLVGLGCIKAASENGIDIPGDLSILGFDNIVYSGLPKIEMDTIDQKKEIMAKYAFELLIKLINEGPGDEYINRIITPTLIKRNSCKKI